MPDVQITVINERLPQVVVAETDSSADVNLAVSESSTVQVVTPSLGSSEISLTVEDGLVAQINVSRPEDDPVASDVSLTILAEQRPQVVIETGDTPTLLADINLSVPNDQTPQVVISRPSQQSEYLDVGVSLVEGAVPQFVMASSGLQGIPGPPGTPGMNRLEDLLDVDVVRKTDGSVMYFDFQASKFVANEVNTLITLTDGGNF